MIYTSGSTGRPKGVEVPRSALVHQICWLAEQLYLTPDTRILQKTPISFDAAQWEILAPAVGACTVCGSVGTYRVFEGDLMWISEEMIRENDVIAINQSILGRRLITI